MARPDHEEPDNRARARVGSELVPGLRLTRLLAVGDLGAVYAADRKGHGKVAVKLLHPEIASDLRPDALGCLEVATEVAHPRAIAPMELLTSGGLRAVVMRLISGESAAQLNARRRGRIPPSEALRITCDTLELIGIAHAHGVRHGALSLSHVLLDDDGAAYLIGFGEARLRAELGLVPERSFAAPSHDPRAPSEASDLWAVGALLFTLLCGHVPRDASGRIRSLASVTQHAPMALVQLTERALAEDPETRFGDAERMHAALRQIAAAREIQYAHSLGSALAAESGSHAWLDPARVTQRPLADPGWSSTPPVSPHLTPPSRPASLPPETPRSRLVPTLPPESESEPLRVSEPPAPAPLEMALAGPRGTTPPSGVAPLREPAAEPQRSRPVLPAEQDPLASLDAEAAAERDQLVRLLTFDSALSLEEAWKASRHSSPPAGGFERALQSLGQKLGDDDGLSDLALELSALAGPDPDRLVYVTASSLEGPALGPTLEAFGPALREHVSSSVEHEPHAALHLLLMLHDRVRAPKAMLRAEQSRVLDAIASPGVVRALYARLGAHVSDPHALESLTRLLPALGPGFAAELGSALPQISDMSLQAQVLHHLESELTGHEQKLGELARTADAHLGIEVARILARIDTLAAREALATAAESHHAVVRIEALGVKEGASGEKLRLELKRRLEEAPGTERIQTLRALADHEVRVAAPFVALRLKSPTLDALPFEERRALFHALAVLAPARAEVIAIEILGHKKLISTTAHEDSRALAASVLGEVATTEDALDALSHHAERHFGTGDRVRRAAYDALAAVRARLASGRRSEPPRAPGHPDTRGPDRRRK